MNTSLGQGITNHSSTPIEGNSKFYGFDYLRAIFSIAIVANHTGFFYLFQLIGLTALIDIFHVKLVGLAVPVFFQVSLFLFYLKSEQLGLRYFLQKRLPKLIYLYIFWFTLKILWDFLATGELSTISAATSSIEAFLEIIISGGHSPFYFFFSLIFITTLAELLVLTVRRLNHSETRLKVYYSGLFISCVLVLIFSIVRSFDISTSSDVWLKLLSVLSNISKWDYNPLNFLPYIFTAAIVCQELKAGDFRNNFSGLKFKMYGLIVLFLAFTIIEWHSQDDLIHYARPSLIFGSWFLLYQSLFIIQKPTRAVTFISGCSLGIYGFHLLFSHTLFPHNKIDFTYLAQLIPGLDILAQFTLALTASIALTLIFRKLKLVKNFV